jgi:hypothetical protein
VKQNTVLGFLSLLLVVSYFLVWQIKPVQYTDPARFLPEETLLYVEQNDFNRFLRSVESSRLGKSLKAIDFSEVGRTLSLPESSMEFLEKLDRIIDSDSSNLLLNEVFSRKVALAFIEPEGSLPKDAVEFFRKNGIFVARPAHPAGIVQKIVESGAGFKENIEIATRQYGDHFIKNITIDGEIFSTVILDGYFLGGFSERALRRCIDSYDGELPSLAENQEFRSLREQYSKPDQFIYFSVENTRNLLLAHLGSCDFPGKDVFEKEVASTRGFTSSVYGAWRKDDNINDKIIVTFNPEMVSKIVEDQTTTPPSICDTIKFSPEKPLLFYWTNTINFKLLYHLYGENLFTTDSKFISFAETIEELSGKDLIDFIGLFGHEISYILMKNDAEDSLALPYGLMIFKIEDHDEIRKTVKKLVEKYQIPMDRHLYGSGAFYSWTISPKDGLEPLYGFMGDYFYLGNGKISAREIIDSAKKGLRLLKNYPSKQMVDKLLAKNNSVSFTDNAQLIDILKSVLKFAGTVIAIEDRQTAVKVRIILEKLVNPILDGLKMFDQTTTRSYFAEDRVVIESVIKVAE